MSITNIPLTMNNMGENIIDLICNSCSCDKTEAQEYLEEVQEKVTVTEEEVQQKQEALEASQADLTEKEGAVQEAQGKPGAD